MGIQDEKRKRSRNGFRKREDEKKLNFVILHSGGERQNPVIEENN